VSPLCYCCNLVPCCCCCLLHEDQPKSWSYLLMALSLLTLRESQGNVSVAASRARFPVCSPTICYDCAQVRSLSGFFCGILTRMRRQTVGPRLPQEVQVGLFWGRRAGGPGSTLLTFPGTARLRQAVERRSRG
jgi:hypothetical protein